MSALPRAMQSHLRTIAEVRAELEYLDGIWPTIEAAAEDQVCNGELPTFAFQFERRAERARLRLYRTQRAMRGYLELIAR